MKCGINGAEHDFNEIPCGINGAVRQASELWIGVNGATQKVWPLIEVGYQEILDTVGSGEWTCPASGDWQAELHGGGGGGGGGGRSYAGGGGGGSGELYTVYFAYGQQVNYSIGEGGAGGRRYSSPNQALRGSVGGTTMFGSYSINGGNGGVAGNSNNARGGTHSGSLSRNGGAGGYSPGSGGVGNSKNPDQLYGTGGAGGRARATGGAGEDGAIILTYIG